MKVFQRSAPYILPRADYAYSDLIKAVFSAAPWLMRLYRLGIFAARHPQAGIHEPPVADEDHGRKALSQTAGSTGQRYGIAVQDVAGLSGGLQCILLSNDYLAHSPNRMLS